MTDLMPKRPSALGPTNVCLPRPPKEHKIVTLYPKIESIGSTGSIILAILEVQVYGTLKPKVHWTEHIVTRLLPPARTKAHFR